MGVEPAERVYRPWEDEDLPGWGPAKPVQEDAAPPASGHIELEPFVFDPGPILSKGQLAMQAERAIRQDEDFKKTIRLRKGEVHEILQKCVDGIYEKVQRGAKVEREVHFPVVHPIDFNDYEALAEHDYNLDLHSDHVDVALKQLVDRMFKLFWKYVTIENERKAMMLERYAEALHARMETMEYHLRDRASQLCNLRYSYYMEITHLRHQVYIQRTQGENFEPVEAYYFDPADHLEENLRKQLNDNITSSVSQKDKHLRDAKKIIDALEDQLAAAARPQQMKVMPGLKELVQSAIKEHTASKTIHMVFTLAKKEMEDWAKKWAEKSGLVQGGQTDVSASLGRGRAPSKRPGAVEDDNDNANTDLEDLRRQLEAERRRCQALEREVGEHKAALVEAERKAVAADARASAAEEKAYKKSERVVEKEQPQSTTGGSRESSLQAALDKERREFDAQRSRLEGELDELRARLEEERRKADSYRSQLQASGTTVVDMPQLSDNDRARLAEHSSALERLASLYREQSAATLGSSAGLGNSTASKKNGAASKTSGGAGAFASDGAPNTLLEHIDWLSEALTIAKEQCESLEKNMADLQLEAEEAMNTISETPSRRKSQNELEPTRDASPAARSLTISETPRSNRGPRDGTKTIEVQTNITAHGNGGFYLLEVPPTEAEDAINDELEDLTACANANWQTTLEQIRMSQRPPYGIGNGFCARGCFIRLLQGAYQRLARHDEMIAMVETLKRAELKQTLTGVHFLMESVLPDDDAIIRDAIFGRGFTVTNISNSKGLEFTKLGRRWRKHMARIVNQLLTSKKEIELGLHRNRRTFIPGGGAGGCRWISEGLSGAGGGLMARQKRDFSPPRGQVFMGVFAEESDDEDSKTESMMQGLSVETPSQRAHGVSRGRSMHESVDSFDSYLAVRGRHALPFTFELFAADSVMSQEKPSEEDRLPLGTPRAPKSFKLINGMVVPRELKVESRSPSPNRNASPKALKRGYRIEAQAPTKPMRASPPRKSGSPPPRPSPTRNERASDPLKIHATGKTVGVQLEDVDERAQSVPQNRAAAHSNGALPFPTRGLPSSGSSSLARLDASPEVMVNKKRPALAIDDVVSGISLVSGTGRVGTGLGTSHGSVSTKAPTFGASTSLETEDVNTDASAEERANDTAHQASGLPTAQGRQLLMPEPQEEPQAEPPPQRSNAARHGDTDVHLDSMSYTAQTSTSPKRDEAVLSLSWEHPADGKVRSGGERNTTGLVRPDSRGSIDGTAAMRRPRNSGSRPTSQQGSRGLPPPTKDIGPGMGSKDAGKPQFGVGSFANYSMPRVTSSKQVTTQRPSTAVTSRSATRLTTGAVATQRMLGSQVRPMSASVGTLPTVGNFPAALR